jgi:hypothetical protein
VLLANTAKKASDEAALRGQLEALEGLLIRDLSAHARAELVRTVEEFKANPASTTHWPERRLDPSHGLRPDFVGVTLWVVLFFDHALPRRLAGLLALLALSLPCLIGHAKEGAPPSASVEATPVGPSNAKVDRKLRVGVAGSEPFVVSKGEVPDIALLKAVESERIHSIANRWLQGVSDDG